MGASVLRRVSLLALAASCSALLSPLSRLPCTQSAGCAEMRKPGQQQQPCPPMLQSTPLRRRSSRARMTENQLTEATVATGAVVPSEAETQQVVSL